LSVDKELFEFPFRPSLHTTNIDQYIASAPTTITGFAGRGTILINNNSSSNIALHHTHELFSSSRPHESSK